MGKKGFAGLAELLGETPSLPARGTQAQERGCACARPGAARGETGSAAGKGARFAPLIYLLFFAGVVSVIAYVVRDVQENASLPASSPAHEAARMAPAGEAPAPLAGDYVMPDEGEGRLLSLPQIQWCLKNSVRINALRSRIQTPKAIEAFNRIVRDHNARCGSFLHSGNALREAQKRVEKDGAAIVAQAAEEARRLNGLREGDANSLPPPKMGTKARVIWEVQRLLNVLGYDAGVADGRLGSRTRKAVKDFQRARGLAPTGALDENLYKELIRAAEDI